MATGQRRITVGAAGVKSVRIGTDGQTHPTTRIVVDLDKACTYELTPGPAGKLVLTLHANAVAKASATPNTVASSPAPAARPMSPFAPRVMETRSAPKAETTPATKPTASASTDYVFVEPSYQAKSEAKADEKTDVKADAKTDQPADEPTVRAGKRLRALPTRLPRNCFRSAPTLPRRSNRPAALRRRSTWLRSKRRSPARRLLRLDRSTRASRSRST